MGTDQKKTRILDDATEKIATIFFSLAVKDQKPDDQLRLTSEAMIIGCNNYDQASIGLLPLLKRHFRNDLPSFRKHLQKIYADLPKKELPHEKEIGIKLKLAILKEILNGWRWWADLPQDGKDGTLCFNDDSKECLKFVCEAFGSALIDDKYPTTLSSEILNIVRDHFHNQLLSADAFTPWIILDFIPPQIATTLLKARASKDPTKMLEELRFINTFDLHNRSGRAIALAKDAFARIKRTEELAAAFVEQIRPRDKTGSANTKCSPFMPDASVDYFLQSEKVAVIEIEFREESSDGYKTIIGSLCRAREEIRNCEEFVKTQLLFSIKGLHDFQIQETGRAYLTQASLWDSGSEAK